ncbi:hypothetical protein [Mesorhizobium ventifaucium]|uniref:Uncharacterized protein n=1 Tax=Mesorhizobium ventifaucium TaxID=666020 RepID=A0ABM9E0U6_9HYPH|nr:hypothetical protein [Mesorhizobium ventifaucium]CAH2402109.1 hypothetical protein MES4922_30483 [Mesorhizobium ventifaucium]
MQLDLFASKKTPAIVYAFPLHRRADMVRKIAAALNARSYQAGQVLVAASWPRAIKTGTPRFKSEGHRR